MQSEKIEAAIYCRVANANENSLAYQRDSLRRMAAERGFTDCAEYLDNGESGRTLDRPALNRLSDDIRAGKIQTIFVKSPDRISRDIINGFAWFETARERGANVIFENGAEELDELFNTIREAMTKHEKQKRQA